jgi:hypothetical protein
MYKRDGILKAGFGLCLLAMAMGIPLNAAAVDPSVTASCSIGATQVSSSGLLPQVGTQPCSLTANGILAETDVSLTASAFGNSYFGIDWSVGAGADYYPSSTVPSNAQVTESLTLLAYTPGPQRLGLARATGWTYPHYNCCVFGGSANAGAAGSITNGSFHYSTPETNPALVPFMLGVPFTIVARATASGTCYNTQCADWVAASVDAHMGISVYEADGVTPVSVLQVVPEPSFFWPILAVAIVPLWRAHRLKAVAK